MGHFANLPELLMPFKNMISSISDFRDSGKGLWVYINPIYSREIIHEHDLWRVVEKLEHIKNKKHAY